MDDGIAGVLNLEMKAKTMNATLSRNTALAPYLARAAVWSDNTPEGYNTLNPPTAEDVQEMARRMAVATCHVTFDEIAATGDWRDVTARYDAADAECRRAIETAGGGMSTTQLSPFG